MHMAQPKHTLSHFQSILSTISPFCGVYNNQEELKAFSFILERHMNHSKFVISALDTKVQEVKKVVLKNRMALELLLAAPGGACSLISDEWCTYESNTSESVQHLIEDTAQGLTEI